MILNGKNTSSFVACIALLCTGSEGVPAQLCSQGLQPPQELNTLPENCLLAQRTQMSSGIRTMVTEAAGESERFSHAMMSRVGAKASVAVDAKASMGSQATQWLAYRGILPEVLAQLENSRLAVNGQLEDLIDKFIAKQSGSSDACHSQLLEAKHQLNQLHQHVHDLSMEVNATDHEVTALNDQVEAKLKEHDELNAECDKKIEEVEKKKTENLEMLTTYKNEMEEMKQIANPNVSMDQKNLTIIGGLVQLGLGKYMVEGQGGGDSLLQVEVAEGTHHSSSQASQLMRDVDKEVFVPLKLALTSVKQCMQKPHRHGLNRGMASILDAGQGPANATTTTSTTTTTFDMSHKVISCGTDNITKVNVGGVEKEIVPRRGLSAGDQTSVLCSSVNPKYVGSIWLNCKASGLEANVSMCVESESNATKCESEKKTLLEVFIKVYVQLARLINDYEEQTTTGYESEKTAVEDQCRDRRQPLQEETSRIASLVTEKVKKLEELRPKLEDATDAEAKLREQVKKLTDECALLPSTTSDLDKVRDAIKALSLCPGLSKVQFKIPTFLGSFVDFTGDAEKSTDAELDAAMTAACRTAFSTTNPGVEIRAAEVPELVQNATHNMPLTNTADKPLLAACHGCEGDADALSGASHKSGHARFT
jgi:predicted nuclease with TOPRIM domain